MAGLVVKVQDLVRVLDEAYPFDSAAEWDKNGLLVGDPNAQVTGVVVALDPSREALKLALERGANVLLTHHPLFLGELASLNRESSLQSELAFDAIRQGIALINCHTNLDLDERAKRLMGDKLGLNYFGDLPSLDDEGSSYAALWKCPEPVSLEVFSRMLAQKFGVDIRTYGAPSKAIERVATATGSGRRRIDDALAAKVDLLIAGEIPYHDAQEAEMRGLATIAIGHDVSEWPLAELLAETLRQKTFLPAEKIHLMKTSYSWNPYRTKHD